MSKFTPGMKVTYTPEARQAWIDAKVATPLPTGDGLVVRTPEPYLSVPGLVYIVWDSLPGKWTLTDERALMQVTPQVLADRPKTLAELYLVFRWAWSNGEPADDQQLAVKMGDDFARMAAAGEDVNLERTDEEWDALGERLHLWLGMDGRA